MLEHVPHRLKAYRLQNCPSIAVTLPRNPGTLAETAGWTGISWSNAKRWKKAFEPWATAALEIKRPVGRRSGLTLDGHPRLCLAGHAVPAAPPGLRVIAQNRSAAALTLGMSIMAAMKKLSASIVSKMPCSGVQIAASNVMVPT